MSNDERLINNTFNKESKLFKSSFSFIYMHGIPWNRLTYTFGKPVSSHSLMRSVNSMPRDAIYSGLNADMIEFNKRALKIAIWSLGQFVHVHVLYLQPSSAHISVSVMALPITANEWFYMSGIGVAQWPRPVAQCPRWVAQCPRCVAQCSRCVAQCHRCIAQCHRCVVKCPRYVMQCNHFKASSVHGSMGWIGGADRTFAGKSQESLWQDWYISTLCLNNFM